MPTSRFTKRVEKILRLSGWTARPSETIPVPLPAAYKLFPAAEKVLKEFGGLAIGRSPHDGKLFAVDEVSIDPDTCGHYFDKPEERTDDGYRLYPLGTLCEGTGLVLIDERGYIWGKLEGMTCLIGRSFDEAISKMMLGIRYWLDEDKQGKSWYEDDDGDDI